MLISFCKSEFDTILQTKKTIIKYYLFNPLIRVYKFQSYIKTDYSQENWSKSRVNVSAKRVLRTI